MPNQFRMPLPSRDMGTIGSIVCLALVYVIAGALGLQLAVPPGYATVIWPASGLAIAGLLLFGRRLWPGILAGSFMLNSVIGGVYADGTINFTAIAIAALIAGGSTLQALLAYHFVRKLYGIPIRIGGFRDIAFLGLVCGPLSCVVAATVGVTTLLAAGTLHADLYLWNWLTWWLGDTIGVLVFLPIGLLIPWRPWSIQWAGRPVTGFSLATLVILAVPLGATFYAWKVTSEITNDRNATSFALLADDNLHALVSRLNSYKQALDGGAGLYDALDRVTLPEWRAYVDTLNIHTTLPGINGIGFIEPVENADLDLYARKAMADGVAALAVHPDGVSFDNFIIKYIEPVAPNREAIGLNIGFEKYRFDAAVHARDTGRPTITRRIFLVQDQTRSAGFLLLRPLYSADPDFLKSVEARRQAFRGWVYAPFVAPRFLDSLTSRQGSDLNLSVYDGTAIDEDELIFSTAPASVRARANAAFRVEKRLSVMEQEWTLVWESTPAFNAATASNGPLLVLGGGMALSVMFGVLLLTFARREETIQATVARKTRELTAREHQTRSIVDTAMVGIVLLDEDRIVLSANQAAEEIFATSTDEMTGRRLSDLLGHRMADEEGGAGPADGTAMRTLNGRGEELYLEVQVNPWTSESGEQRHTAIIRDVTAEESAKQALEKTEQRWKYALEGAEIGVFDVDFERGKSVVSPTWKVMLGFGPDEEIDAQEEWASRIHPDDKAAVNEADRACISGETQRSVSEYRIQRADGVWIWLRSDAVAIARDKDGKAKRMIGTQTNITELRRTLAALQASEERFRTAIQDAPVGMAMASLDREWIDVNDALCRLLGYSRDELIGKDMNQFVYSDDIDPDDARTGELAESRIGAYQREMRFVHRAGHLVWVLVSVSAATDPDDDSKYLIKQFQDITDQKEMEQLKTEFVATVSHELRTPLTSIRGSLGLVLGAMNKDLPENASRLISIAHSNCERLVLLINDILDLEKISSGKMRFDLRREDLSEMIRQAFDANQGYADEHGVKQVLKSPLPRRIVNVDQARLHQVFANLLSNAAKFSPSGSTITMSAEETDKGVRVLITDQGPGIPAEFRGKIFNRFSQADGSATRSKGGTGLGLNISKQIVEQMGGEIGFDSTPGEGSTFWIELPAQEAPSHASGGDSGQDRGLPSILHVEDDRDFREVVAAYLQEKARTTCTATVQGARKLLADERFDMVIIDVGLYNENGLDLLDDLSEMDVPIVVLSAREDFDRDPRVTVYLSKSLITETQLVDTVVAILDGPPASEEARRTQSR